MNPGKPLRSAFLLLLVVVAWWCNAPVRALPDQAKFRCMEQFAEWCKAMDYRAIGGSLQSFVRNSDGSSTQVFCATDPGGTNCTKNGQPWVLCTAGNQLYYKNRPINANTRPADVDNDICSSAVLMFQNIAFNNETMRKFHENMDSFHHGMDDMMKEMSDQMYGSMNGFDTWQFEKFGKASRKRRNDLGDASTTASSVEDDDH